MKLSQAAPEFDSRILEPEDGELVYPVYTLPLHEFKFHEFCKTQGITSYLPLKRKWKINSYMSHGKPYSNNKIVYTPMIPSYVFVKTVKDDLATLRASKSIVQPIKVRNLKQFLYELNKVHCVELENLMQEVEFNAGICEGDKFVIESGIWEGVTGYLKQKENHFQWSVEIEFLQEAVRMTIDPSKYKMRRVED